MIISIISQKGGSGKSTMATNISALAAINNVKTSLIDLDSQASSSSWHMVRDSDDINLEVAHPPILKKLCQKLENDYQLIIIDTPPHLSNTQLIVAVSNYVVIPLRPSSFDLAAAMDTLNMVGKNSGVVLNAIPASTNVTKPAQEVITQAGFEVIGEIGQRRMVFQHAATLGKGVCEMGKSKACDELTTLWNNISEKI